MQAARRATRLLFRPEQAQGGGVVLTTYGRASGFCIDPIEKKPLNHFYPGTSVLTFGTAGCSLGCRFWQNWDISKARAINGVSDWASPEQVAEAAARIGCRSIAFTYNDPVIFAEYRLTPRRRPGEVGTATVAGFHPALRIGSLRELEAEARFCGRRQAGPATGWDRSHLAHVRSRHAQYLPHHFAARMVDLSTRVSWSSTTRERNSSWTDRSG
jgi:hypothetical protein